MLSIRKLCQSVHHSLLGILSRYCCEASRVSWKRPCIFCALVAVQEMHLAFQTAVNQSIAEVSAFFNVLKVHEKCTLFFSLL